MVEPVFNSKDAKYKCCLDSLHVDTVATIICVLGVLWHLLLVIDFFAYKHASFWTVLWLLFSIFSLIVFGTAFAGIIDSKLEYIHLAVWYMKGRLIASGFFTLIYFGAHIPASFVEQFCRHIYKKMFKFEDQSDYKTTDHISNVLLHSLISLMLTFWIYDVINKCYKYYSDKAAHDKLTLPQTATPPAQAPLIKYPNINKTPA